MNSGVMKRAIGLTLAYLLVFGLVVLLQFGRNPGFMARSGRLAVSATFSQSEKTRPVSAQISFAGLVIGLSNDKPAKLVAVDGSSRDLSLAKVERLPSGAKIGFEGGIELHAVSDGSNFALSASAPNADWVSIVLPYSLQGNSVFQNSPTSLVFEGSGASYSASLTALTLGAPAGLSSAGKLSLPLGADSGLVLKMMEPVPVKQPKVSKPVVAQGPASLPAAREASAFKADLDAWVSKAWSGLSSGRWDSASLGWRDASGANAQFSEKALVAYLAEAAARGSYSEAYTRIRPAKNNNPGRLSYLSAPFLGETVERMRGLETADRQEAKRLSSLVQAKDPSLFQKEGLVHFLMDRSSSTSAQEALRYAASVDASKLGTRDSVGYLACAVESISYLADAENPFAGAAALADRLVGAIKRADTGYFLTVDDGSVDFSLSLRAGLALVSLGTSQGKTSLVGAGQALVDSALSLSDANGFLPAKASIVNGALAAKSGSLAPEEIYPLIASSPYYPREISFYREAGHGVWAWTAAPSMRLETGSSRYLFTVSHSTSYSHYMAIYGVRPFKSIKLYDIDYSPDSAFESYDASGYLYSESTSGLYLKMKHKAQEERIDLHF
jgi:hypothetical protein